MIILLHGSNAFASREQLNHLHQQFQKQRDPGGDNIVKLDGTKLTIDELNSKLSAQSLLAQKRLVTVYDLFDHKQDAIFKNLLLYLQNLNEGNDNVLIFYEARELDAKNFGAKKLTVTRKKLFDFLQQQQYSKKFLSLNNRQLIQWVKNILAQNNLSINTNDLNLLITGKDDQWQLYNDLNKLIHFAKAQNKTTVEAADIKTIIIHPTDDNIFNLTDAISNNNTALFFSLLESQIESGASEQQIISMLIRQFKIILQIKEMLVNGKNINDITTETRQHPFVIKKAVPQTRNFNINYLKNIITDLTNIEYKIKTGQIKKALTALNLLFIK